MNYPSLKKTNSDYCEIIKPYTLCTTNTPEKNSQSAVFHTGISDHSLVM